MPKLLRWSKGILYIFAAVMIFLFHEEIIPHVAFLVGGVVLAYALEELIYLLAERHFADIAESLIQIVLAILLFLVHDDIIKICVIWGVWSIIREGREMTRALVHLKTKRLALVDIAESVTVTVLSAFLVLEPGHHHAKIHLILLGIELLLEILFPLLEKGLDRLLTRRKQSKSASQTKENAKETVDD